jgi:hypothetical protein
LNEWDWSVGRSILLIIWTKTSAVVVVDMIGDNDLNVYKEKQSDPN